MPKITKLCLHLLKLCRKNCGLFFSRHGVETKCLLLQSPACFIDVGVGTTVFRRTWNFEPSHGICQFPCNFCVFTEFCWIQYWYRCQMRHILTELLFIILVEFRWPYCMYTWFLHQICRFQSGSDRGVYWKYWAELIWNIDSLFGRQNASVSCSYWQQILHISSGSGAVEN